LQLVVSVGVVGVVGWIGVLGLGSVYSVLTYVLLEEVVFGHSDGQADEQDHDHAYHHNLP